MTLLQEVYNMVRKKPIKEVVSDAVRKEVYHADYLNKRKKHKKKSKKSKD